MKKSLLAMAVLAVAAGAAQAQSSVELYGLMDVYLGKDKGGATGLNSGGLQTSRFGFRGTEDLGGGLKASFVLEQAFNADNGTATAGTAFSRQAYVGFSGGFGEVKLGKVWTAYDDVAGAGDPVFNANAFSPLNLVFKSWANYAGNPGNTIYYATPEFGGFSGAVSYSLDESTAVKQDIYDFHVKYANGPLFAALAYQNQRAADLKFTTLTGSYDFSSFKLLATYAQVNAPLGAPDTKEYALGVDFPLSGSTVVSVGYGSTKDDGAKRGSGFGLGVTHSLSKRTTVYAGYGNTNAQAQALRGSPDSRFGVGLRHTF